MHEKRVFIETYGCTLNQADSEIMRKLMTDAGCIVNDTSSETVPSDCDFVVINTCTVKKTTEQKILSRLKSFSNFGPKLIVAGCMAGSNKDLIERAVPNASIITTSNVDRIAEMLSGLKDGKRLVFNENRIVNKAAFIPTQNSVIAKIPVSDGCLSNCTFCETKHARSALNSFSENLILNAIEMNVRNGAREIELTAQDTGAYGLDRKTNIAKLASKAADLEGDFRIRIGMLNPEHLHKYFDELIDALNKEKVFKFVHLPLQSGSDRVLKDMARRYAFADFLHYTNELHKKVPGITIATDMIVGFPTESDEDFSKSIEALDTFRPEIVNISMFGARPHAKASKMQQVESRTIKRRSIEMSRKVRAMQAEQRSKLIGAQMKILLTESKDSSLTGRDDSYNQVAVSSNEGTLGEFAKVKITGFSLGCLLARRALESST